MEMTEPKDQGSGGLNLPVCCESIKEIENKAPKEIKKNVKKNFSVSGIQNNVDNNLISL